MKPFVVRFRNGKESFRFAWVHGATEYETPFYVVNILVKAYKGAETEQDLIEGDKMVCRIFNAKLSRVHILGTGRIPEIATIQHDEARYIIAELEALFSAVGTQALSDTIAYLITVRLEEAPPLPKLFEHTLIREHQADTLLQVAWAEIWHAYESKIERVKRCPYCWRAYVAPKNNPNKMTCGSAPCNKARMIAAAGGLENFRHEVNSRKMRSRGSSTRPVGRPKKAKEVPHGRID